MKIAAAFIALIATVAHAQQADAQQLHQQLSALRAQGCTGHPGATGQLQALPELDQAARMLSQGSTLKDALQAAKHRTLRASEINLAGYPTSGAVAQAVAQNYCGLITDARMSELGAWRMGNAWWLLLAEPFRPPAVGAAGEVAERVLVLANAARQQPRRCGKRSFRPAKPLVLNRMLTQAAAAHADEMARYGYLEHKGREGKGPGERAARAGYRWRSIGENIAAGQTTADKVVADWLASPHHCENIMEPSFTEMGVAFSVNAESQGGVYWAQSLALPR